MSFLVGVIVAWAITVFAVAPLLTLLVVGIWSVSDKAVRKDFWRYFEDALHTGLISGTVFVLTAAVIAAIVGVI